MNWIALVALGVFLVAPALPLFWGDLRRVRGLRPRAWDHGLPDALPDGTIEGSFREEPVRRSLVAPTARHRREIEP